jgi:hypothetical protein
MIPIIRGLLLLLRFPWFFGCRRFARIFGVGQANIAHRRVVAGKGYAIGAELGVLELLPGIEFLFHAGLTFCLGAEPRRGNPAIGSRGLGSGPQCPE